MSTQLRNWDEFARSNYLLLKKKLRKTLYDWNLTILLKLLSLTKYNKYVKNMLFEMESAILVMTTFMDRCFCFVYL